MGNDTIYNHKKALDNIYTTHALRVCTYQSDEPFNLTFSAASTNQGAESDGITLGEVQVDVTTLPTVNVGVGQNWKLGNIVPGEEQDFYFPLKGWNLLEPLTVELHTTSDEIRVSKTFYPVVDGRVQDSIHIRILPSESLGIREGALVISGGGLDVPATRTLWVEYDVNPFQSVMNPVVMPVIKTEGCFVKIRTEHPATIKLMSVDGKSVSYAEHVKALDLSLKRGVYLISVNGKMVKYLHHSN